MCSHCFRFIGSLEQQLARHIAAVRCGAAATAAEEAASDSGSECGSDSCSEGGSHVAAALALEESAIDALASGQLRLSHSAAFPLPPPTRCRGGCAEEWYCGEACAEAAWQQYHQLLCLGPGGGEADAPDSSHTGGNLAGKGKAPVVGSTCGHQHSGAAQQLQGRRAGLIEFLRLADDTNDVFRLAAIVVARVLLAAEQQLPQLGSSGDGGSGSAAAGSSSGGGSSTEPSYEACWQALLAAWQPFAAGHKAPWWEVGSPSPEAAADMRQLAADALQLLTDALPPALAARYPALLQLPVWGSIIGAPASGCLAVLLHGMAFGPSGRHACSHRRTAGWHLAARHVVLFLSLYDFLRSMLSSCICRHV